MSDYFYDENRWPRVTPASVPPPRPPAIVPEAGTVRLGERGAHGYVRGGVSTEPWLIDSLRQATRVLPQGYRAEVISSVDPRSTGTPWHPAGRAIDIQIYDPQGNKVPNLGDRSKPGYDVYENVAAAAKVYQQQRYPNEKFTWGGHFHSGTPYDRMHFQSGGPSAEDFPREKLVQVAQQMHQQIKDAPLSATPVSAYTAERAPLGTQVTDRLFPGMSEDQRVTASLKHNNPDYVPPDYAPVQGGGQVPLPRERPLGPATTMAAAAAPASVFEAGAAPLDPTTGMRTPGNIDLSNRPVVKNPDGTISTVRSAGVNIDGNEVLLPTITPEGQGLTTPQAVERYKTTGENLGTFYSPEAATNFATAQHRKQDDTYSQYPASGAREPPSAAPSPQNRVAPGSQAQALPPSLGDAIIKALGPRGAGMSTYIDPNTRHQIINPGGSGEEAMGLTRDIGPLSRQTPARPTPAPQVSSPPSKPAAGPVSPPPTPAAAPAKMGLSPFEGVTADEAQRRPIGPAARPSAGPVADMFNVKPAGESGAPLIGGKELPSSMFAPPVIGAPGAVDEQTRLSEMSADPFSLMRPTWAAPPEAGRLAAPSPEPTPPQRQTLNLAPWGSSTGGSALPLLPPSTVSEQTSGRSPFDPTPQRSDYLGLSPLATGRQQQPNDFASTTLLPFQQWPPPGWDWGGGGGGFAGWGPASFDFGAYG